MPILLIISTLMLVACFAAPILSTSMRFEQRKDDFPIVYPVEPMLENYQSVLDEIENCVDETGLKSVYVRIIIFEGCYSGCGKFVSSLIDFYNAKEAQVL